MIAKWTNPILAAAAAFFGGGVALTETADQRAVASAALAAGFLLVGVWVVSDQSCGCNCGCNE